jgi:putative ABC transport system permease protein
MRAFLRKLTWLVTRRRREAELREELDFHLAEETEDRTAAGLAEEQARLAARRELGNVTLVVEDTRAAWGWIAVEQIVQDVRYAARQLARTPSVTVTAAITLALGIGLTTAMFSIVRGILLRPLAFDEPDRLIALHTINEENGQREEALSPPNFMSLLEEESRVFASVAGYVETGRTLTGVGEARRVDATRVSGPFFDVLHAQPLFGRTFLRQENEPGHDGVVVLSHALWQQQFGSDPGVIGRDVQLDGVVHRVIGVMPPGFDFPGGQALWVPQPNARQYFSAASVAGRRNNAFVGVVARLRPSMSMEAARTDLAAFARRLEQQFPEANRRVTFTALPLHEDLVGDVRTPLLMLFGAVGFVLFIAAANVAGLLLARGASRREEIALRGALGAGRARIVRQLVTESLLLGVGGGLIGLLLATMTTNRIVAAQAEGLRRNGFSDAIRLDVTVLAFAVGVTILAAVIAGLLPALRAANDGLAGTLQTAGRGGVASPRGHRLRSALVVGQLALAVVLLHGAGLLVHSFARLTSINPGFRTEGALAFQLDLSAGSFRSAERVRTFVVELVDAIMRQPGVVSVGAISRLPIGSQGGFRSRFQFEGRMAALQEQPDIGVRVVTPDYFQTLGMALRRGRGITDRDGAGSLPVIVINETAAARFFPDEDPIGHRLVEFGYDPIEEAAREYTIVGVVTDVRSRGLSEGPQPEAYFAHAQVTLGQMFVVVRTTGDPLAQAGAIRNVIIAQDAHVPVPVFRTLEQVVWDSLDRPRFFTTLLTIFSAVALALAAVGIFGLLSFAVARRTRDFGVRIALGASPALLLRSIVRDAFGLVVIGLAIGLAGAFALTRVLEGLLFEVTPTDPMTFAAVAITLGITALLASVVPGWRAAAVDPLVALRAE